LEIFILKIIAMPVYIFYSSILEEKTIVTPWWRPNHLLKIELFILRDHRLFNLAFYTFLLSSLVLSTLFTLYLKLAFFKIIAWFYELEIPTVMDDFWLYDLPVNPMNVPTVLVFNRPD
jgi:hypothetical protein